MDTLALNLNPFEFMSFGWWVMVLLLVGLVGFFFWYRKRQV